MENFETLYIVQNTPTIAENALKNYLWHHEEIFDTIAKSCNHAREYHYYIASVPSQLHAAAVDLVKFELS